MMRRLVLLPALLVSVSAWAQQPPPVPAFAPITLSEASYKEITGWLMDQPAKFSIPMLQWLEAQERAAAALASKPRDPTVAPAKAEPPPKPDGK